MELMNIENSKKDINTGLVIHDTFLSRNSGYNYLIGSRDFGKLKIIEELATGTAVKYLCGVKVFNENGELIIDKVAPKNTHYSREVVKKIVLKEMCKTLKKALEKQDNVVAIDEKEMKEKIDDLLDSASYDESYKAVLNWASDIGII